MLSNAKHAPVKGIGRGVFQTPFRDFRREINKKNCRSQPRSADEVIPAGGGGGGGVCRRYVRTAAQGAVGQA